jgi:hypothetical protein
MTDHSCKGEMGPLKSSVNYLIEGLVCLVETPWCTGNPLNGSQSSVELPNRGLIGLSKSKRLIEK